VAKHLTVPERQPNIAAKAKPEIQSSRSMRRVGLVLGIMIAAAAAFVATLYILTGPLIFLPCQRDLQCAAWMYGIQAQWACAEAVEKAAKWQVEWTNRWYERRFPTIAWNDKVIGGKRFSGQAVGELLLSGDRIKAQNGFGAWQHARYACSYFPLSGSAYVEAFAPRN
jgi:hypothetical protein